MFSLSVSCSRVTVRCIANAANFPAAPTSSSVTRTSTATPPSGDSCTYLDHRLSFSDDDIRDYLLLPAKARRLLYINRTCIRVLIYIIDFKADSVDPRIQCVVLLPLIGFASPLLGAIWNNLRPPGAVYRPGQVSLMHREAKQTVFFTSTCCDSSPRMREAARARPTQNIPTNKILFDVHSLRSPSVPCSVDIRYHYPALRSSTYRFLPSRAEGI